MKPPSSVASFFRAYIEKRLQKHFGKHLAKPLERLQDFGFAKTRRAIAALSLSFFVTLYLLLALNAPAGPEWTPAFLALALCYLVAFVGVVAEWFWGAWFASGLGWSGVMVAVLSTVLVGWNPALTIYGGLHGLVVLLLLGKRVAALYEQQDGWKQRLGMDDYGVARLRKTVTRAAASLPSLVLWALGPKEPGQGMVHATLLIGASLIGIAGLGGLIRLRGWSVIAVAVSAVALIGHGLLHCGASDLAWLHAPLFARVLGLYPAAVVLPAIMGTLVPGVLLASSLLPLARPTLAFLFQPRR
jgi:hypothetical protein